jgi:thiol-disulfide isomerase/thioredoxin
LRTGFVSFPNGASFNILLTLAAPLPLIFALQSAIMKKILLIALTVFASLSLFAQSPEVSRDASGNKILVGFINPQQLASDTAFTWWAQNTTGYTPEASALQAFRAKKDSIHILAFGGTWCGDTKYILPKFFSLTNASGLSPDRVTLLGVDQGKKTIQHLAETFNVVNVPTFIVLKNGKEIGRVVEYGTTGIWDKELGEIVAGKKK